MHLLLAVALALALTQPTRIVVSVAASMRDALAEIAEQYKSAGVIIDLNTGGSNTLARQIVEGAPADLFLSADDLQMTSRPRPIGSCPAPASLS
jgi:molybdate transport system substrate-binding protein